MRDCNEVLRTKLGLALIGQKGARKISLHFFFDCFFPFIEKLRNN
jgi:hypothetical protein